MNLVFKQETAASTFLEGAETSRKLSDRIVFGLMLFYIFLFYSQIAGRFPVLAPLRIEFYVGGVLVFISLVMINRGERDIRENQLNILAMLFIGFALFTIPFSLVRGRAFETFISLFKFFAIYLMIISTIDTERRLKAFFVVYLSMITLLFIEPFFMSLQGKGFIWNNHMWRLAGVTNYFGHPNQLGGITSANLPFFYFIMGYTKSMRLKILSVLLIVISLRVIMLTQSRTAFVGVLSFFLFVFLLSRKKLRFSMVAVVILAVLWFAAPDTTKERFITLGDTAGVVSGELGHDTAGTMYSRRVLIKRGFEAFSENPVVGLGLNNFISFNGMRYGYYFPPHNTYIQALAEMGIIGFTIFMCVILFTYRNLFQTRRLLEQRERDSFISRMAVAVTVYLSIRIMVSMFGQDLYANYWWLAGALSVVILRIATAEQAKKNDGIDLSQKNGSLPVPEAGFL